MFARMPEAREGAFTVLIDGKAVPAQPGDSVAAVLMAAGLRQCRTTPVTGAPRGPYCMMGACFDCLVTIDGVGNRQACLTTASAGMDIRTQRGRREVGV